MTQTRNDPWNAWNLWTALIALAFFLLWLIVCPLHLFGGMAAMTAPSINPLASSEITTSPFKLSGTGTPNSSLQVRLGEKTIGPIAVGADGTWNTSADLKGLQGQVNAVAETLAADGSVAASSAPLALKLNLANPSGRSFTAPAADEALDAQSYILEGTGTPSETLEIWQSQPGQPAARYATAPVGADGKWSYVVDGAKPGTKPGTYTYELRAPGKSDPIASRTLNVKAGLTSASNANCPCKLRIFTNLKQKIAGSSITLFKDGQKLDSGTSDKLFSALGQGSYTYSVSAPNFKTYTSPAGQVSLPRNKSFEVYLEPVKRP